MLLVAEKPETKEINGEFLTLEETFEKHGKLIHHFAQRFKIRGKNVGLEYGELVSLGKIGFIRAYNSFDQSRGFKFSTYVAHKINGELSRYVVEANPGPTFPRDIKYLSFKVKQGQTEEEIAAQLEIPLEKARLVHSYKQSYLALSIEKKVQADKEGTIADTLKRKTDFSSVYVNDFLDFIERVKPRYKTIVVMLMEDKLQREIGEVVGLAQPQVNRDLGIIRRLYKEFERLDQLHEA